MPQHLVRRARRPFNIDLSESNAVLLEKSLRLTAVAAPCRAIQNQLHHSYDIGASAPGCLAGNVSHDPAAANNFVAVVVENSRLSRRDGALRLIKLRLNLIGPGLAQRGTGRLMPMPNLHPHAQLAG